MCHLELPGVHFHGRMRFSHERKDKLAIVGRLTKRFEQLANGAEGWRMADAPADYMETMLANIVAFEIGIDRVTAKSKLSQTASPATCNR